MKQFSNVLVGGLLCIGASPLQAATNSFSVSGDVALTTDYVFRGLTQTNEEVAIQGGIGIDHSSGGYASVWGSSLNFDESTTQDRAHVEIDYIIGYSKSSPAGVTYDLGWIYYTYPGAAGHLNYDFHELALSMDYERKGATLGLAYNFSPEFFGEVGKAHYFQLQLGQTLKQGIGLSAYVGRQTFSDNDLAGDDYTDYGVSLSYAIKDLFDVSVHYTDTDLDDVEAAEGRAFFMISKEF